MKKGIVVFCVCALGLWWLKHRGDTPATPAVTQPTGSGFDLSTKSSAPIEQASLSVIVTDAKGPVAKARIRIAPEDGDVLVLETGTDGIAMTKLAPGSYSVSASAADHTPAAAPKVELASAEIKKLPLTLEAGGRSLSGAVTDVNGGPIAGARIDAARLGNGVRPVAAVATTLTGADGKYSMTVAEGQLMVAARSTDYAPQSRYVDVGAAGATADFALVPGGVIEGVVLDDRSKQPAAGAQVFARRDSAGGGMMLAEGGGRVVTSMTDGRFRITGLRPGAYELSARVDHRRSRSPTQVGLGVAEQITDVQLLVGTTPMVRGKVVDGAGAPIANAVVRAMGDFDDEVKTSAKGEFTLAGLPPGSHMLFATAETFLPAAPASVEVADKDVDNVAIRMTKAGKLVGHVEPRQAGCDVSIDPERRGMGMAVMMMVAPVTTIADGSFELGPLRPGEVELSARCTSGDQGKLTATWTAGTDVVVPVTPGGSIAGKVVDGDGKPVAGATVMASGAGPSMRTTIVNGMVTSGVQGITSATGTYQLTGLAAGKYRLSALDRGRPLRTRKDPPVVTLAAGEKKTGVDLAVDRPNGVIKGIVTGPDGKPLADAWVSVSQDLKSMLDSTMGRPGQGPPDGGAVSGDNGEGESRTFTIEARDEGDGSGYPPALTNAKGEFEITGLPHLAFEVVAEAKAGKLRGRADAVTPDATLSIKALGVTSLSGTVRGPRGPAGLFTVELEGPTRTQRSFTDGTFSLGRVDPGTYVVRVRSSDGNAEARVTVQPDTPSTVDILLVANAIVIGTVVDPSGKPVADIPLTVVEDSGDGKMQISIEGPPPMSGPDGKFRIEHKAGKVMLVVNMMSGHPVTRKGLQLEEGKTFDAGNVQIEAPH